MKPFSNGNHDYRSNLPENMDWGHDGWKNLTHHIKTVKKRSSKEVGFVVAIVGAISLIPGALPNRSCRLIGFGVNAGKV